MNGHDPFEERLRRQRWQQVPPEWREEILLAAANAAESRRTSAEAVSLFANSWKRVQEWMWPHPRAWAGLAAAWILVFALNWAAEESPSSATFAAASPAPVSPHMREILREQQRLLADLSGPGQSELQRPPPPGPQGRNRSVYTNA